MGGGSGGGVESDQSSLIRALWLQPVKSTGLKPLLPIAIRHKLIRKVSDSSEKRPLHIALMQLRIDTERKVILAISVRRLHAR